MVDLILLNLEGQTKADVLFNIAKAAKQRDLIKDEQLIFEKFLKREAKNTTAIDNGIALPEAYSEQINPPFAFILCRTKEPVDFESLDGKPARIILASLVKDKTAPELLKTMAEIAGLLRKEDFRGAFLKVKDENEVISLLKGSERWKL